MFTVIVNLLKAGSRHAKLIFLDHEIGCGEIVQAKIQFLSAPSNRKDVRFLGMIGYYRRLCPNFSQIAKPLTYLLSPKLKFEWTKDCNDAFEIIKSILM